MTTGEDIATFWLRRSSCDMTFRAGQKLRWKERQQWVILYHHQCLLVSVCAHTTLRAGQKLQWTVRQQWVTLYHYLYSHYIEGWTEAA